MHHSYYVVCDDGEWKVRYEGRHFGPYESQKEAYRDAVEAARRVGENGDTAQVFVQRRGNHEFRAERTYGHDPYPPPG